MVTRRMFLKYTGGTALTLFAVNQAGIRTALAQAPGGSLGPYSIPKFQTPLLIPPVMPKAGRVVSRQGKNVDYYEISMRQFSQQILPVGLPSTVVWGYGVVSTRSRRGAILHHAPSLTIEARWNTPVRVKWINDLKDSSGNFLPHLLPVDQTLHWANPPGGTAGRDMRPEFTSTPGRYTGPVPIVTHVHGAVGVGDESDGYAEAWFLCDALDIPAGYAVEGTWYQHFSTLASQRFGTTWGPGYATFQYPNLNRASTIWYHDHALGMTRLNVYAGPAGFYLLRGGPHGDDSVIDVRSGGAAVLPGPAPRENDGLGTHKFYREIPIAIQDRSFNVDGSLFYPDSREFFDGVAGPYIPQSDISPTWNPEFFGNTMMVNGNTWPFQVVEKARYRFRFLNGCQARFLILDFGSIPGVEAWQIGNDGGFLESPVNITQHYDNRMLLGPAERADTIIDFSRVPAGNYVLGNVGPDEPFGGGEPGDDFDQADPGTTGQVLQFRVVAATVPDRSTPPGFLQLPAIAPLPAESVTRALALLEEMSDSFDDAPAQALLGTIEGDPNIAPATWTEREWMDPVTENPAVGNTEIWEIYNMTADAHPMHIHEITFEVVNRQAIEFDETSEQVVVKPGSTPMPPHAGETGRKDTAISYPGEVLRLRGRFDNPGQFVWHCHIVEHEDNEMMRPFRVGPVVPGQPG